MKEIHKIHNLQNLKKDVLEGIEEKVIERLEILIAKWRAVKQAYEVDPRLLPHQISAKMLVAEALPQVANELKEISILASALAVDPFLVFVFDWDEKIARCSHNAHLKEGEVLETRNIQPYKRCSYNDHLEEGEVDADNGEPRCKKRAIYTGCWEGWGYGAKQYCRRHMSVEYDWRWYALLPLTMDILK